MYRTREAAYSDEDDVGSFNSDVSARSNCDSDVGLCERRRVIHSISDHRNNAASFLQLAHLRHLVRR